VYSYYIERMLNLPLNKERQHREWLTILRIAQCNKFPPTLLHKLRHQIENKTKQATPPTSTDNNKKWATFNFTSPHIRRITNLFKNTSVKVAFRCHNTVGRATKSPNDHSIPHHNKWGIYQLTCNSCNLLYVGQTSRSLRILFQQHIRYIWNNNPQSAFAQHILHNQHKYGEMNNILSLLKPLSNPNILNPYEKYYIQSLHQEGKLIPERNPGDPNPLFKKAVHPSNTPHE
jgi:hypothetical protein